MKTDRINLLSTTAPGVRLRLTREHAIVGALATVAVLIVVLTAVKYPANRAKESRLQQLEQELSEADRAIATMAGAESGKTSLREEIARKFTMRKVFWGEMLKELSQITPPKSWLTNFSAKPDGDRLSVSITAEAIGQQRVSDFYANLEDSYYFRHSAFKVAEQLSTPDLFRFQVESKVSPFEFGKEGK